MRKGMPEWLKKYYNKLWLKHGNQAFTFKDVTKKLGISRVMTIKILWELEQRGFVNKERSEIDYRSRTYRLISPEDISFVTGLYSLVEKEKLGKQSLIEKLLFIDDNLPYTLTGSYAAYHYHHYMLPPSVVEIKIEPQDDGKWIAFLTDEKTRVFIGDIIEARKISNYVKLTHSTGPIDLIRTKTEEGYYIEKPESLLMELLERQTQTSITEAIAIILQKKDQLRWYGDNGIIKLADSIGFSRKLGLLLDAINLEAHKPVIKTEIIQEIRKDVKGKSDEIFPRDEIFLARFRELRNKLAHQALLTREEMEELERIKRRFEGYDALSEKWGIQSILPKDVIRKVLEDLGVRFGKK
jgi:DNA-binding transcriptional regulator YhcF (GntR family)